jgi:hypothetical protein
MHGATAVPPVVCLRFMRTEVSLWTTLLNTYHPYYKHYATDDVFNHIRRVYGEDTFGSQVRGWWWREDESYDEDDTHVAQVHHRVSAEIGQVMWREHINKDHVHELHMSDDGHQFLWKRGCGQL